MDHELFNDNDSFEQFLRESTEDFKMYPSRKVWYSLYNNLHPGRKWPSLAVCIILISAILFMDVSNNNKINNRTQNAADTPIANSFTDYFTKFDAQENTVAVLPPLVNNANKIVNPASAEKVSFVSNTEEIIDPIIYKDEVEKNNVEFVKNNEFISNEAPNTQNLYNEKNRTVVYKTNKESKVDFLETNSIVKNKEEGIDLFAFNADRLKAEAKTALQFKNMISESLLMKSYQDDHAFYNKPLLSKFLKNASLQFYITPSVGYRAWFKNKDIKLNQNNAALIAVNPTNTVEEDVNQNAAYNMEVGLALNYKVSKKIAVKLGVQFNNTNYVINAGQLFHPTQTTLLLENSNTGISTLEPHTSYYSNRQAPGNEKRLFNKTTQFSLPVGLDYEIGRKRNITWYAGASIQPTYVAAGEANVLSADARNYVKMPSLLRTWNANTSLETFVSIETKAGFSVNVGPQFRYQLLSTYDNDYNYSEKLYNIGIKLGITRAF